MGGSRISDPNSQGAQQRFRDGGNVGNVLTAPGGREGLDNRQNTLQPASQAQVSNSDPLTGQQWNGQATNRWRGGRGHRAWGHTPPAAEGDGSSSEASSGRIGRMQRVMRHLSGSGRGHTQPVESSWGWWPFGRGAERRTLAGRRRMDFWRPRRQANGSIGSRLGEILPDISLQVDPHMAAMVSMVREVLPHIPDEMIVQDLRRTNSASATVNNFL